MAGSEGSKYYNVFLNYGIWLENKPSKEKVVDSYIFNLLSIIRESSSLSSAAEQLNISYRKAWGDVKACEKQLGFSLIERTRGGDGGGSSRLSEDGNRLLDAYIQLNKEFDAVIHRITKEFFHTINQ